MLQTEELLQVESIMYLVKWSDEHIQMQDDDMKQLSVNDDQCMK